MFPIYVPSKGRANLKGGTLAMLAAEGIRARIVVEPSEAESYANWKMYHELVILPASSQGITFARNFTLDHARQSGSSVAVMIDDDVQRCYGYTPKPERASARAATEGLATRAAAGDAALYALEYQQFAWSQGGREKRDSYADVFVAWWLPGCEKLRYRQLVDGFIKEDRDFAIQAIANGTGTVRMTRWAFAAPKNGSNRGGLFAEYATGRETLSAEALAAAWPDFVRVQTKNGGRVDARVEWPKIRKS